MSGKWECVGAGWQPIVKPVVRHIESVGGLVNQVKEKFGGLRIYYAIATEPERKKIDRLVQSAEWLCENTCEECGDLGKLRDNRRWLKTLCDGCAAERN